jgi:putative PIN family toxin of toxin-antitoxin system
MLRAVLDTSTLVSFVLTTGEIMRQVIAAWRADEFVLVTSPATLTELHEVLERPAIQQRAKVSIARLYTEVVGISIHVAGRLELHNVCRDPKDDKFLACAVEGEAHYLVSSDKDLLDMASYEGVCILNPGEFLAALQLHRFSVDEIQQRYSRDTLQMIQATLCLDLETGARLVQALEQP